MVFEADGELERRVRVYGALADAIRMRVVDELGLGDRTPGELQDMLGLSSNLLAHHLKVLEVAGLVGRKRSEADRRRSYLQLVPEALEGLMPARQVPATRVVFVCTANSARSQLAAALWQRLSAVPVTSAGTDPAPRVAPGAVTVARRHGLSLAAEPQSLHDVGRDDDVIVTVCDRAHEEVSLGRRPGALHWSVVDPVPIGTQPAFEAAYVDLARRVTHLVSHLPTS